MFIFIRYVVEKTREGYLLRFFFSIFNYLSINTNITIKLISLLELLLFEMLDFFPTSFRKFAWTVTLGLLSMLLNIFIPGVLSFSGIEVKLLSFYLYYTYNNI